MSDIKQQQKEQLRVRLKAAQKNKRRASLEKRQRAGGRVTVKMISQARKNKDTELYAKLVTKYKTQESLNDFLNKERARKWKIALANEKKRTAKK
tara:strand:- start:62 stop:346 length:285 start_codon:yes stop_codon:yes gene_type:complete